MEVVVENENMESPPPPSPHRRRPRRSGFLVSSSQPPPVMSAITQPKTMNATASPHDNFVVQSIRRGSQEWRQLVKPFVSDLVFYSVVARPLARQPMFRPFTTQAAVLFCDLSGYSKIAHALEQKGAHALSAAVNGYLDSLLSLVRHYGGDVLKFAGDAVLCVWYSNHRNNKSDNNDNNRSVNSSFLPQSCLAAALCATQMQQQAGSHVVEGTNHVFQIHIGLCCGTVESEIFTAPVQQNMQKLYHLVGGEALAEIGDLVDLAKAGQVCISHKVYDNLVKMQKQQQYQNDNDNGIQMETQILENMLVSMVDNDDDEEDDDSDSHETRDPHLLLNLAVDNATQTALDDFMEDALTDRLEQRDREMEEDFIHPAVLDLLSHGGYSPTQIAQMRDLVVLFIGQTSHGSPANWLLEVQTILDRNKCPIIQVVDDDKGVHVVAAVNAVHAVPESRLLGLEICRQLLHQQVGVAIGMAAGSTFCGVIGSSHVACRWDITGGPPVRAARLMQYALRKHVPMAIDESLSVGTTIPARLALLQENVPIKGSPHPIRVFTLSETTEFAAMNLLESVHGEIHNAQVQEITKHITGARRRSCVIVTGPTLAGKKIVCQRAAGFANMVPFLHVSDSSYGLLQLVRTIAKWFKYMEEELVSSRAKTVIGLMDQGLYSRAHDECLGLVDDAMDANLGACFVVDQIEFLDEFSISFIRECLHGRRYRLSMANQPIGLHRPSLMDSISNLSLQSNNSKGRISFLCVHVPIYNSPSSQSVANDIHRSHRTLSVPIIEVREASMEEFKHFFLGMSGARFEPRVLYTAGNASGNCVGYFIERAAAIGQMQPARAQRGEPLLLQMNDNFAYDVPAGRLREYRTIPVQMIGPEIAMKYAQFFDELPPLGQVICKTLAVISQIGYYWAPRNRVWEVVNDLIAQGVTDEVMTTLLQEMSSMYSLKIWVDDNDDSVEYVKFQSPALADVAMDVCTPVQIESIAKAWIERLKPDVDDDFRVPLALAWLQTMTDPCKKCMESTGRSFDLWRQGYQHMMNIGQQENWSSDRLSRWQEVIACDIEAAGFDVLKVLGPQFSYNTSSRPPLNADQMNVWLYRGPIGLGPLGNTMSVLCELISLEALSFLENASSNTNPLSNFRRASKRYLAEVDLVEELLQQHELGEDTSKLLQEKDLIEALMAPASEKSDVIEKIQQFHGPLLKQFVAPRLDRLRTLANKLEGAPIPAFVSNCSCSALGLAYKVMFRQFSCMTQANEVDTAQHVLMILATRGWEPRPTPEPMRHLARQSVARLRNAVVRTLSYGQIVFSNHQQSSLDLKAFLLTTSLLFEAQDSGRYTV